MKIRRIIKWSLLVLLALVLVVGVLAGSLWWYFHPEFERRDSVVYTQRHRHDLTFDIVTPKQPNGLGIVLMVSGGWRSGPGGFRPWMVAPVLRRGYTVFAVSHLSQPQATVMEIVEDVNRAVRFIRYHADEYGIDPNRLGVTGGSAGGHLSLMLATRGGPGPADANDPIDRESSSVQAVAIFYPVTDLLNLGASTENPGDGGPPKSFVKAFGPDSTIPARWQEIGREMSPIYYVTADLPPTLIYHGNADTLVPLDQSERFQAKAREAGRDVKLVVHSGGQHGWITMFWDIRQFANWFDQHLSTKQERENPTQLENKMLEALKTIGAVLGIIAVGWNIANLFRSYLHIHLDLDHCGAFLLAKATVENRSLKKKRIDNALLLVGPEDENPVETYNQLVPITGSMPTATCTNDITATPLPEPVHDGHGRMLIPLDFFYSENVAIADEQLSYVAPLQTESFEQGIPYAVRFFVWQERRLHRSTHGCFILNVWQSERAS